MVNYLEVPPAQADTLKDSRKVAAVIDAEMEIDGCLEKGFAVLAELRNHMAQCGGELDTDFNKQCPIHVVTDSGGANFLLVWVASNRACLHMVLFKYSGRNGDQEASKDDPPCCVQRKSMIAQ